METPLISFYIIIIASVPQELLQLPLTTAAADKAETRDDDDDTLQQQVNHEHVRYQPFALNNGNPSLHYCCSVAQMENQ